MKEETERLLHLQKLDLRIDQLRKDRKALPGRKADAEAALRRAEEAAERKGKEIREAELQQTAAEKELQGNDEKIKRCMDRQATAKNDRELAAAKAEQEALERTNDEVSERVLPLMESLPEMREEKEALDAGREAREKELAAVREEAEREEKEIDELLAVTERERREAAAAVERSALARYERIVSGKGLPGLARVERDACEVCCRAIPPQRLIEIRKRERWIQCEGCGRILAWRE